MKQIAESIINNHLSLMFVLDVSICTRSSSGSYIQRRTSRANSKMHVWRCKIL